MKIDSLRQLLGTARDGAMLRLALARLLMQQQAIDEAESHLEAAVSMEPDYTAAWKELGKLRLQAGRKDAAREAWTQGMERAARQGDKQAEKEMSVFLRRLDRSGGES